MLKIKILYKISILSIATFVIFLSQFKQVEGGELLDLANEHVDVYLVPTLIDTMKPLIAEKILKDINFKKESLDLELDKEINKAEDEINKLMAKAPEKINRIAIETSSSLINQLIGADVNNSSISAIVEDLSLRNRSKYYDN